MSNVGKKDGVSRREFLKHASTTIGGITLVSLGVAASCSGAADPPDDTTIAKPPNSSDTSTASNTNTTYKPPFTGSFNIPEPELMQIPDCDARVALDRKYSPYHIWVYPMPDNIAYIGATESLHKIAYVIKYHFRKGIGDVLSATREDTFCYLEGAKVCTDLITPVSGTIISINRVFDSEPSHTAAYFDWLATIELSNPNELNTLLTPQYYAYLESPSWSEPIPQKH